MKEVSSRDWLDTCISEQKENYKRTSQCCFDISHKWFQSWTNAPALLLSTNIFQFLNWFFCSVVKLQFRTRPKGYLIQNDWIRLQFCRIKLVDWFEWDSARSSYKMRFVEFGYSCPNFSTFNVIFAFEPFWN